MASSRRSFMQSMVSAAALGAVGRATEAENPAKQPARKPNIVLMVADQGRWDFIGALGHNPTVKTPNLDRVVQRGGAFTPAVTNQPLCSPARACMMTGRYATETGEWNLPPGVEL